MEDDTSFSDHPPRPPSAFESGGSASWGAPESNDANPIGPDAVPPGGFGNPGGARPPSTFGNPSAPPPGGYGNPGGASLPPPISDGPGGASPFVEGAGYGYGYGQGHYVQPTMDKGARTSLIAAIVGIFICGVLLGPAAVYEGTKARKRIRESNGALTGDGLALAGIVLGCVVFVLSIIGLIFIFGRPAPTARYR